MLRPRPIYDAAKNATGQIGSLGIVIQLIVAAGIMTSDQGNAVLNALVLIGPVVSAVSHLLVAFRIVRQAEAQVTPLSLPQAGDGTPLVPRAGDGSGTP